MRPLASFVAEVPRDCERVTEPVFLKPRNSTNNNLGDNCFKYLIGLVPDVF